MAILVFEGEVTIVKRVRVEIDTDDFTPEFQAEFNSSIKTMNMDEHANHLAWNAATRGDQFVEGYGYVKHDGKYSYQMKESDPRMNINIKCSEGDVEVDIEEKK